MRRKTSPILRANPAGILREMTRETINLRRRQFRRMFLREKILQSANAEAGGDAAVGVADVAMGAETGGTEDRSHARPPRW
jgi:hypothetical protein